jgi:putative flavoprotein involved in K+ transport
MERDDMQTTVVVVGAGQAGLAMSRCLTDASIDHVILEKGSVAQSWRSERWDSLRLLTPNWMTGLPGFSYRGEAPDGYMRAGEVVDYLNLYRASFDAPVVGNTPVTSVRPTAWGYEVETNSGRWKARGVVIASGAASTPRVPALASALPRAINQISPLEYRNPDQINEGGVLVVGGSASGIQIADELAMAGFDVALSMGEHVRVPRLYRGMDIHWWLQTLGVLDESYAEVVDLGRARSVPSLQLIGSPGRRDIDINSVTEIGVRVVGRLVGASADQVQFSGSLRNMIKSADLKQDRLLDAIDSYASAHGLESELTDPGRPLPTIVSEPPTQLNISNFKTIVWATGYRPDYPWLDNALLDRNGAIAHDGGVMTAPGLYSLGLLFMRRRKSNFIGGVGDDAADLTRHLLKYLDRVAAPS